ncbi:MAG TPA: DUF3427 domain-containing protein [Sedimenticola sp.]|nr:DUF3427 domain-containing protein [Sedimenticola sp.]
MVYLLWNWYSGPDGACDYGNHFRGDELVWFAKTGSKIGQPSIQSLLNPRGVVNIFYREDDRSPFTYAGAGRARSVEDISPVKIVWSFLADGKRHPEILAQEIIAPETVIEGAKKRVTVNVYERDPNARRKCIQHWGESCCVCGFDFAAVYGELGEGFMHVHHLKLISEVGEEYQLDPISDLRPVCPNCHAMLHRESPPVELEKLKEIFRLSKEIRQPN